MIIKCEKCNSEFNFNEQLIKKNGSSVRCSLCKHVFKVFPPEPEPINEPEDENLFDSLMEETVALDLPPDLDEFDSGPIEKDRRDSFDKAFEDAIEEVSDEEDLIIPDKESFEDRKDTAELHAKEPDSDTVTIEETQPEPKGKSKVLLIILSIVLFVIIVLVVIFFFFPSILPNSLYSTPATTKESVVDEGVKKLDFKDVDGHFAESDKAGKLFFISGSVINNYTANRNHILLKGNILGKDGKSLKEQTAYAGNTFTTDQLKQLSKEDIAAAMKNPAGTENCNVDVKPGSAIPFMIFFVDLPDKDKMDDLQVEALSSSPNK